MSATRKIIFALPSSDPASAVITAWLAALPADMEVAPLLRQALANGIQATRMLERIEARLDALQSLPTPATPVATPSPPSELSAEEAELLGGMLDFGEVV